MSPSRAHRPTSSHRFLLALSLILIPILLMALLSGTAGAGVGPTVFINEIHYDNAGTDIGEFVEIAGPAGTDLAGYAIVLYNGSGGAVYDTDALSGSIPNQQNGFGTVLVSYPSNGIQNGSPDGIALVNGTSVVQFLSYEGSFVAVGGPANGMTSIDIGVSQGGSEPVGASLYLTGTGTTYDDFTWRKTVSEPVELGTRGQVNNGQIFSTPTPSPSPSPSPSPTPTPTPDPVTPSIVISQVYGGGGNSGATLKNDFIELFNPTSNPVSINGWSVQYASSTGSSWAATPLAGSILPGRYFLVQQAAGSGGTTNLPTPDATGTSAMAAGSGKVALVNTATPLTGSKPVAGVVDLVGYGGADYFEGTAPAPGLGSATSAHRARGGCRDTNDNRADFAQGSPNPRNSASPERSCIPQVRTIPEVQGSGAASPLEGVDVTTTGIVTALKQNFSGGSYSINGFFMQSAVGNPANPDSDGNPATSEGIFVFTSTPPPVFVGDIVTVNAAVVEFFGLTQLSIFDDIVVISRGNPLPAPITLDSTILSPAGTIDQLERLEGMRVHAPSVVSIAPTSGFGEIFTVLAGVPRAFREPGIEVSKPLPDGTPCCVPRFDENPERLMIDSDGLAGSSQLIVTSNVTINNVTGPLDFAFSNYKLLPEGPLTPSANMTATPVPAPAANEFTIASYNLLNLFSSNANFNDRLNKASFAIRNLMRTPDIIGVAEVGDLATLTALANRINIDAVSAGDADPQYQAHLLEGSDQFAGDDIDVGLLVKLRRVEVVEVFQRGKGITFLDPSDGTNDTLFERPPLVLRALIQSPTGSKFPVTVISNHLQSLIDVELTDGRGNRQRQKRRLQAEFTANLAQELQNENLVLVGDFNSFQFNDGYVDVIGTIKGVPTPSHEVVLSSADLVNPDLTALVSSGFVAPGQRYSYVFGGNAQALDHILVDNGMLARTTRYAHVRANADFPTVFRNDPTRVEGSSDHDMPVGYFCFPFEITGASVDKPVLNVPNHKMVDIFVSYTVTDNCFPVTTSLSVTSNEAVDAPGSGNTAPDWEVVDDHRVRVRAERSGEGTGRIYTITITATDTRGHTVTEQVTVTVPK